MTGGPSWWNQIRETVGQGVSEAGKRVSIESLSRSVSGWFRVDEAEVQEILRQVRAELPTTEALLVGKPQSGKSSIVRSLTGVSAEIVGQGFRPHTQYTQQYSYPTQELPLLVFTDTVGLGDGMQETSEVIRELIGELQPDQTRAKVLILTVKISDFATDTLKQIASQIRAKHSEVPCLLAVTCLHELYPAEVSDHPDYPPSFANVDRAFSTIQQNFAGLFDRAVLIDFTLEEDEFHSPFYGLEAFIEALSELLPEAEARTIAQLLNDRDEGKQIGELYRDAGRRYILPFSVMAGAAAAIPIPLATMPVLTALQVSMVGALGQLYGQTLTPSQAGGVVSAIAGGFVAQAIGRELIKFVPGFGSVIAASWASAYTWALGEAACVYFGDLLGGKNPDPQRIQAAMKESFQLAKERFKRP
ncbi:50S ribosome-binding GTPase [Leptolyngbya sp. DQ-M1]|uniref:GTPase family protein n=1 Tax=Leptolyngbya sp. DQ-M1 TaxID=2933920 RepID=UPI0032977F38